MSHPDSWKGLERYLAKESLVDELITQCQLTPNLLSLVLLELELAGRLQRHTGHKVSLKSEELLAAQ